MREELAGELRVRLEDLNVCETAMVLWALARLGLQPQGVALLRHLEILGGACSSSGSYGGGYVGASQPSAAAADPREASEEGLRPKTISSVSWALAEMHIQSSLASDTAWRRRGAGLYHRKARGNAFQGHRGTPGSETNAIAAGEEAGRGGRWRLSGPPRWEMARGCVRCSHLDALGRIMMLGVVEGGAAKGGTPGDRGPENTGKAAAAAPEGLSQEEEISSIDAEEYGSTAPSRQQYNRGGGDPSPHRGDRSPQQPPRPHHRLRSGWSAREVATCLHSCNRLAWVPPSEWLSASVRALSRYRPVVTVGSIYGLESSESRSSTDGVDPPMMGMRDAAMAARGLAGLMRILQRAKRRSPRMASRRKAAGLYGSSTGRHVQVPWTSARRLPPAADLKR